MHNIRTLPAPSPARAALAIVLTLLLAFSTLAPAAYAEPSPEADASIEKPLNLNAQAQSSDTIVTTWSSVAGAQTYEVYRSTSEPGPYELIGISTSTDFVDVGLVPNTTYYYRVVAVDGSGNRSDMSDTAWATTLDKLYQLFYYRNYDSGDTTSAFGGELREGQTLHLSDIASVGPGGGVGADWTRPGYQFVGWEDTATGAVYQAGEAFAMPFGGTSLRALWAARYTVTYDGNGADGGTVPTDANNYAAGDPVTVASDEPTKTGYAFAGWTLENDGSVHRAGDTFAMPDGGALLTARWAPQADAHQNALALDNDDLLAGDDVAFLATGHRQDEPGTVDGETRYVPVSWTIGSTANGSFPAASPYRSNATMSEPGSYTVTATYAQERYVAGTGWQRTGATETLSQDFTVRARPVDPVDPVNPVNPTDPADEQPPLVQVSKAGLPKTGDTAPFVVLGALAALGAFGALVVRRKLN
ncbi:InlB B-repeat-containing protein [Gordonibacter massiliensis (ex Traore et al. 2017)]|uniref:InlB B-repeat-containing protein n=1 Tax=Gordonibacter massiliensis (ex Traore et al. 2017) TaxID=1841863 RepID=UPI001C8BAE7A|nr:InlB B-repeat-containing protein [Gordonibacter massiliensis (ex Traore et al. 2017)]MBX9035180.1 LPXTG cell wall anchor domain-containing protein [Gordonibacter massiliensis (ex Traore et al. 2017)]